MKRIPMLPMLISATILLSSPQAPRILSAQVDAAPEEVVLSVPFGTIVWAILDEGLTTVAKARKAAEKGYRQVKAGEGRPSELPPGGVYHVMVMGQTEVTEVEE